MIKNQLFNYSQNWLDEKLADLKTAEAHLQEGLVNETKSSAGDKFETTRAHIQREQAKLKTQLAEQSMMQQTLKRAELNQIQDLVALGAYVETTKGNYLISIPVGKIKLDNAECFAISLSAPIALSLLGIKVGDKVRFRNKEMEILVLL